MRQAASLRQTLVFLRHPAPLQLPEQLFIALGHWIVGEVGRGTDDRHLPILLSDSTFEYDRFSSTGSLVTPFTFTDTLVEVFSLHSPFTFPNLSVPRHNTRGYPCDY